LRLDIFGLLGRTLATVVSFPEEMAGDFFPLEEQKYTVNDPSYIGAAVGQTMPQFKDVQVILIKRV